MRWLGFWDVQNHFPIAFLVVDLRSGSANLNKPLSGKSATNKALKWA